MSKVMKAIALSAAISSVFAVTGCSITHGSEMQAQQIASIRRGVTTEAQIRSMFGEPVEVNTDSRGLRELVFRHKNDSGIQKGLAGVGGAILGGVLGSHIGGGLGNSVATGVGITAGGALAENAVTERRQEQVLVVWVDSRGIVKDYRFTDNQSRSQAWGIGKGVKKL